MPEQQQWLEKQIRAWQDVKWNPALAGEEIQGLASLLTSAWPSSPQGLAVKQLVEAARGVSLELGGPLQLQMSVLIEQHKQLKVSLDQALSAILTQEDFIPLEIAVTAARKAGL